MTFYTCLVSAEPLAPSDDEDDEEDKVYTSND